MMASLPKVVVHTSPVGEDGLTAFERVVLVLLGQIVHNTAKAANGAGMVGCYLEPDIDAMLGIVKTEDET